MNLFAVPLLVVLVVLAMIAVIAAEMGLRKGG